MELRHLRYFVRVAEELHFGRAALQLGISQPPLSQQIRALEDELDVRLFDRTSRRVALTEAGRVFLPQARRVLEQADMAVQAAQRAERGEVGTLRIGFTASSPFVPIIATTLFDFRQHSPDVELNLAEMALDAQIAGLAERKLEIGIMRGFDPPPLPQDLIATALLEEPLLIAMRADHPLAAEGEVLTIAHLAGEPFVLYERSFGVGFNEHLLMLCRQAGFAPNVVQEASGLATLLGLVAAGFGLTVVAKSLSALHPDNVVYRGICQPDAISRLWLARHRHMTPASARFAAAFAPAA